jgi:hypothetical protein
MKKNGTSCEFAAKSCPTVVVRSGRITSTRVRVFKRGLKHPEFLSKIITGDETWVNGYRQ